MAQSGKGMKDGLLADVVHVLDAVVSRNDSIRNPSGTINNGNNSGNHGGTVVRLTASSSSTSNVAGTNPRTNTATGNNVTNNSSSVYRRIPPPPSNNSTVNHSSFRPPTTTNNTATTSSGTKGTSASLSTPTYIPPPTATTTTTSSKPNANVPVRSTNTTLDEEREQLLLTHKQRMMELDRLRQALDIRAAEVEKAHQSLEKDRYRLANDFETKVNELSLAKERLENHVNQLELKEQQLNKAWSRFEQEKAAAIADAEIHLNSLASALAASVGINLDNPNTAPLHPTSHPDPTVSRIETNDLRASTVPANPSIYIPDDNELLALADRVVHEADAAELALQYLVNPSSSSSSTVPANTLTPPVPSSSTSSLTSPPPKSKSSISSSPSFTSPSIPGKVQAVKLKTTLQLLAHRTATLHAAVDAIKAREHTLDEREKGINNLVTRVEELAKREEALQRNIEVLQSLTDQSTLKSPVKLNTFAEQEKSWRNSLRNSGTPSSTPVAVPVPTPTPLSPVPDHSLSIRVSLETREHALNEREKGLNERELALKTKEESFEKEFQRTKEERMNEINTLLAHRTNEATTLAANGRAEIEALRATVLAEQERNQTYLKEEKDKLQTEKENVQELLRQTKEMDKTVQHERLMLGRARDEIANRQTNLDHAIQEFTQRQAEFRTEATEREQGLLALADQVNEQRSAYETERARTEKELQGLRHQLQVDQETFRTEQNRIRELFEEEQQHFRDQCADERNQLQLQRERFDKETTAIRTELNQQLAEVEGMKKQINEALTNAQEAETTARWHAAAARTLQETNETERAANAVTAEKLRNDSLANEQARHQLTIDKAAVQTLELQIRNQQQYQEEDLRRKENELLVQLNEIQAREQQLLLDEQRYRQSKDETRNVNEPHNSTVLDEKNQEIQELRSEVHRLKDHINQRDQASEQAVASLNATVAKLTDDIETYDGKEEKYRNEINGLQELITGLRKDLEDARSKETVPTTPVPENASHPLDQERQELSAREAKLRHQEEVLNKLKIELSHENDKRKQQEAMLDTKSTKLAAAFTELQNRREALEARVKEVTAQALQRTSELEKKETELRTKEEELKEKEQSIIVQPLPSSSVPAIDPSVPAIDPSYHHPDDEAIITQLTEVCKQLEQRLGDAKMSALEANSSRDHALQEKANLQREQFNLSSKYDATIQRLEAMENENTSLKDQVRKLETAMENAAARAHRLEAEIQAGRDGAAAQLAKQLDTLQNDILTKNAVIVTNQHRIDELERENKKYKETKEDMESTNNELSKSNQDYQMQLRKYKQTIAAATIARWLRQQRLHALRTALRQWERCTVIELGNRRTNHQRPSLQIQDNNNSNSNGSSTVTSSSPSSRSVRNDTTKSPLTSSRLFSPTFPSVPPNSLMSPTVPPVMTTKHGNDDEAFGTNTPNDEAISFTGGGDFDFSAGTSSFDFSAGTTTSTLLPTVDEESSSPVRGSPDILKGTPIPTITTVSTPNPKETNVSSPSFTFSAVTPSHGDTMTKNTNTFTPVIHQPVPIPSSSVSSTVKEHEPSPEFIVCSICHQQIPFAEVRHHSDVCYVRNKRTNSITHGTPHHHGSSGGSSSGGGVSGLMHGVASALRRVSHTSGGTPSTGQRSRGSSTTDDHHLPNLSSSSNVTTTTTSTHTHTHNKSLLPSFSLGGGIRSSTHRSRNNSFHQQQPSSMMHNGSTGEEEWTEGNANSGSSGNDNSNNGIPMMSFEEFSHTK